MTRPTLNGLDKRINGVEKLMEVQLANIGKEITEIRENELKHLREDVDKLKKTWWMAAGAIGVVLVIVEFILPLLVK